ncbi:MAG: hypothetical protein RR396_06585, partial [Clostridiales bacterium]
MMQMENKVYDILLDSAIEQSTTLNTIFNGQFAILEPFASSLSSQDELVYEDIIIRMDAIAKVSDFLHVSIADKQGNCYNNEGKRTQVADQFYFTEAMAGKKALQNISHRQKDNNESMIISVPLKFQGKAYGCVIGSFAEDQIRNFLGSP